MSDIPNKPVAGAAGVSGKQVEFRDISQEWFVALTRYTPAGAEILEVLQGMAVALGMGGDAEINEALSALDRFRANAPDEYTLGAIAMLMSVCQLQVLSPQESIQILEHQLRRWHGTPQPGAPAPNTPPQQAA